MLKKLGEWLLALALCVVAVEIALHLAVRAGVLHFSLPSYSAANVEPFWQILNRDFGFWHPANGRYHHSKLCFDVTYTANALGMRDREVAIDSQVPRVVVFVRRGLGRRTRSSLHRAPGATDRNPTPQLWNIRRLWLNTIVCAL